MSDPIAVTRDLLENLKSDINSALSTVNGALGAQAFATSLPIIGASLSSALSGVSSTLHEAQSLATQINAAISSLQAQVDNSVAIGAAEINAQINAALASSGFGGSVATTIDSNAITLTFNTQHDDSATVNLDGDFGISGLALQTTGTATATLDYSFGFSASAGISGHSFSNGGNGHVVSVDASIGAPNLGLDANLGFLRFGIQNETPATPLLSGTFTADANGTVHTTGTAAANLHLTSDMGSADFPSISADLNASWQLGGSGTIAFNNVKYDFGQFVTNFVTPILQELDPILQPLHDALAFVNTDLTFLDAVPGALAVFDHAGATDGNGDIGDGRITVLDFVKLADPSANIGEIQSFINVAEDILHWAEFLGGKSFGPDAYNLGSFSLPVSINGTVGTLDSSSITATAQNFTSFLNALASDQPDFGVSEDGQTGAQVITSLFGSPVVSFPVLENPLSLFKLLLGQDVDLVDVTLPELTFGFGHINTTTGVPTQTVPIADFVPFPGIDISLSGAIEAVLDMAFGYDTHGLHEFADGGFQTADLGKLLDGFFVSDGIVNGVDHPEVIVAAALELDVEVGIPGIAIGGGGNLSGILNLNLNDPNHDNRFHFDEMATAFETNPFSLFTASGIVSAGADLYAQLFGHDVFRFDSSRIVLVNYDDQANQGGLPPPPPDLAVLAGQTLQLNIGDHAGDRHISDHSDDSESFEVSAGGGGLVVKFLGVSQAFGAATEILGNGGADNDAIKIDAGVTAMAILDGGAGDDQLFGGNGSDSLTGGDGNDALAGGAGNDTLDGGAGNDVLKGGAGADQLDGGSGTNTATYIDSAVAVAVDLAAHTASGGDADGDVLTNIQSLVGSDTGNDTLTGSDNNDILFGAGGNDELHGGQGDDYLAGGAGADTLDGGQGTDTASYIAATSGGVTASLADGGSGGEAAGDTYIGIEVLDGTNFADSLTGSDANDVLMGEGGSDTLDGGKGDDILVGGSGGDHLVGGEGTDTASYYTAPAGVTLNLAAGGSGGDAAGDSYDSIENVDGSDAAGDNITGDDNPNYIRGFGGGDTLSGDAGDDTLMGGEGNDTLQGGADNDTLIGGHGADHLDGGDGIDIANYSDSTTAVSIDLGAGTAHGDTAEGDSFTAIEGLAGSDLAGAGDTLTGDGNDNLLFGLGGDDTLSGSGGNDTLDGGFGNDTLDGGSGNDAASYQSSTAAVIVNLDSVSHAGVASGQASDGLGGTDTLSNVEIAVGSSHDDLMFTAQTGSTLYGGDGQDTLNGGAGNDSLVGGAGNDILTSGGGIDILEGGDGADLVTGDGFSTTAATSYAHDANAVLVNLGPVDLILNGHQVASDTALDGSGSVDTLVDIHAVVGSSHDDVIVGSSFSDVLVGGDGDDTLLGGENGLSGGGLGTDALDGGSGSDTASYALSSSGLTADLADSFQNTGEALGDVYISIENLTGTGSDDLLVGDAQFNRLDGGVGNDTLEGGNDGDVLVGGDGVDTASYAHSFQGVFVSLATGLGHDGDAEGDTLDGIENLLDSSHNDTLVGSGGDNTITVTDGNDQVNGGTGNDHLIVDWATTGGNVHDDFGLSNNVDGVHAELSDGLGRVVAIDNIDDLTVLTGGGSDNFTTGAGDDTVSLGSGNDFVNTESGLASVDGGAGDDTWQADLSAANVGIALDLNTVSTYQLAAGGAAGTIQNVEAVRLTTGSGNDTIVTTSSNMTDVIITGDGDDTITVYNGNDAVNGGTGNDHLIVDWSATGGNVHDDFGLSNNVDGVHAELSDGIGRVVAINNIEDLTVLTGGGNDNFTTGAGNDTVSLAGGNDFVNTETGLASVDGGAGDDTWQADLSAANVGIALDLNTVSAYRLTPGGALGTIQNVEAVRLTTGSGNDTIVTTSSSMTDVINTGDGDDTITVFNGNDQVSGGTGHDHLIVDWAATAGNVHDDFGLSNNADGVHAELSDGLGRVVAVDNIDDLTVLAGGGNDNFTTGAGDDTVSLSGGNDFVNTETGLASVDGGAGDDTWQADLSAATANIAIDLNTVSTYQLAAGGAVGTIQNVEAVRLTTGSGNDTIVTTSTSMTDVINTGDGDDTITVFNGNDQVNGGTGHDHLIVDWAATAGNVHDDFGLSNNADGVHAELSDGLGRVVAIDNINDLTVLTGTGNDTFTTGAGDDTVSLGDGDDFASTGTGLASVDGGTGNDTWQADLSAANVGIALDLNTTSTYRLTTGGALGTIHNVEAVRLTTGSGNDTVVTTSKNLNDVIITGDGDDTITVFNGNDTVNGGTGNDHLIVDWSATTGNVHADFGLSNNADGVHAEYADGLGRVVAIDNIDDLTVLTGSGNDTFTTGAGDDTVSSGDGDDFVSTGTGVASVDGGAGDDTWQADLSAATANIAIDLNTVSTYQLAAGGAAGTIQNVEALRITTGSGNDTIITTSKNLNDVIITGDGDDTITVFNGNDTVNGGTGNDHLVVDWSATGGNVHDDFGLSNNPDGVHAELSDGLGRVVAIDNIDDLTVLTGTGNDGFATGAGDDTVSLGDGNDFVNTETGLASVDGGAGDDTWQADLSAATANIAIDLNTVSTYQLAAGGAVGTIQNVEAVRLTTGSGNDTIVTTSSSMTDVINTGDGDDTITVFNGNDQVSGGTGHDHLIVDWAATAGNVHDDFGLSNNADGVHAELSDGLGRVVAIDNINDLTVLTGTGNDNFTTGAGNDVVNLGVGNDVVRAGGGTDRLIVDYSTATNAVALSALSGSLAAGYAGSIGDGTASFTTSFDGVELFTIATGSGNDTVTSGDGNDVISTGDGSDRLSGGIGQDMLTGGRGADIFGYATGFGADTITDFTPSEGDRIDLTGVNGIHFMSQLALHMSRTGADANHDGTPDDSLIDFGNGDTLILSGVDASALGAGSFIFAQPTAVSVAEFLANRSQLDAASFSISDTAANIASALNALASDSHIFSIMPTDTNVLPVSSRGNMNSILLHDQAALDKMTGGFSFEYTAFDPNSGTTTARDYDATGTLTGFTTFNGTETLRTGVYHADGTHEISGFDVMLKPYASFHIAYDTDGTQTSLQEYYDSGSLYYSAVLNPDGTTHGQTFDRSGALIRDTVIQLDHSKEVQDFHISGQLFASDDRHYDADGVLTSTTRFYDSADGGGKQYEMTTSGAVTTVDIFDTSGMVTRETITQGDNSQEIKSFGVTNQLYASEDRFYDASGALLSDTRFHSDGTKQYERTVSGETTTVDSFDDAGNLTKETVTHPDQSRDVSTFGILDKPYVASHSAYDSSSVLTEVDYTYTDAPRTVAAKVAGLTLVSSSQDENFTSFGFDDTFVFRPGSGNDVISHFNVGQVGHDAIEIFSSVATSISDLNFMAINNNHDVRITIDDHDTIIVKGVHVADLQHDVTLLPNV